MKHSVLALAVLLWNSRAVDAFQPRPIRNRFVAQPRPGSLAGPLFVDDSAPTESGSSAPASSPLADTSAVVKDTASSDTVETVKDDVVSEDDKKEEESEPTSEEKTDDATSPSPEPSVDGIAKDGNAAKDVPKEPETAASAAGNSPMIKKDDASFLDKIKETLQTSWDIYQDSQKKGYDFKLSVASVIAGEYDEPTVRAQVQEIIASDPCVMFTWQASPSCVSAVKAFDIMGASVKNVRLDDPWDKGNVLRAEIGKMVGKSSVPMIFINGKYVGGYDSGVSDEAPGLVTLAFQGKLRPMLQEAGVLPSE